MPFIPLGPAPPYQEVAKTAVGQGMTRTSSGFTTTVGQRARAAAAADSSPTARLPKGILPIEFSYVNMGNSLTDSQLYRVLGGSAGAQATQIGYVAPFKGHVVGLSLVSTAAISGGTATFEVFRSGVDTGAELVWTSGASDTATFPLSKYTFEPNQVLDIRATTSGYAPTTNDIELFLYIAQDAS